MRTLASRFGSSIAAQVTAVAMAAFSVFILVTILSLEGPFSIWVYPQTVSDNAPAIADFVAQVEQASPADQQMVLNTYQSRERAASISPDFSPALEPNPDLERAFRQIESESGHRLRDRRIEFGNLRPMQNVGLEPHVESSPFGGVFALQIGIALSDGRVLNIWLAPSVLLDRPMAALTVIAIIFALVAISLSAAIAFVVNRPIRRLTREADRVQLVDAGDPVSEQGPVELRQLAAAFNHMRRRLAGLIFEREQIIAAIAHDIRTGLTRVRLRLSEDNMATSEELEADLSQMEKLIADMVAYSRAESPSGLRELIRMGRFLSEMASHAPTEVRFSSSLGAGDEFTIAGDPVALRRLFENLLENARRYGDGEISLSVAIEQDELVVRVDDNGPGIPHDLLEEVFQPFRRIEESRNRATGGSGLGLGIARSIAAVHGATLVLQNRADGGLTALVRFPASTRT
ncbi:MULTISPECIES: ATP-binding protein [Hyphobacterium]|uniref:histidine kinase n=1 Tax=Hyphobacterium vulgare TaxID=1736751 RepID=A0ABV7A0T3_9PROT